jgi:hypothetical protein
MDFGKALRWMKKGAYLHRLNWNGRGMWVHLQRPDENSKMTLPYIYMYTAQGDQVPWVASHTDMLSDDWVVVGREEDAEYHNH